MTNYDLPWDPCMCVRVWCIKLKKAHLRSQHKHETIKHRLILIINLNINSSHSNYGIKKYLEFLKFLSHNNIMQITFNSGILFKSYCHLSYRQHSFLYRSVRFLWLRFSLALQQHGHNEQSYNKTSDAEHQQIDIHTHRQS